MTKKEVLLRIAAIVGAVLYGACAALLVKESTERRLREIEENIKWRIDQGALD